MKHLLLFLYFVTGVISSYALVQDHAKWNYAVEKISNKQGRLDSFLSDTISVVVKYNSNRIDTIKNIQPNSTVTVK